MMGYFGFGSGSYGYGWGMMGTGLHMIFCLAILVGIVLFIVWAAKSMSKDNLKTLFIWLLIVGILGAIVTLPLSLGGFRSMMNGYFDSPALERNLILQK